jgi:large subunit ribosomal protein L7/L12
MAELNQQQVIDYIKGISVLELSQLVKALESELGVSAAAAMPMMMPGAGAGGGAAAAAPAEEKTEFNVTLVSFPADKKINIIKVVREVTSLGLKEAKDLVEAVPKAIKEAVGKVAGSPLDVQPSQERLPRADRFLQDQDDGSHSEPHRDSKEVVRAFSADEPAGLRA